MFNKTGHTKRRFIKKALAYAEREGIKVLSLPFSLHGTNDLQLADQLTRMAAKGFLLVVSAGNEGSHFGGLSFPGSRHSVLTVGSFDYNLNTVDKYSAKGPYLGDLRRKVAVFKPDLLVFGSNILGAAVESRHCVKRSGTSLSAVIFAGAVSLAASFGILEPSLGAASLVKLKATELLPGKSVFAQGTGKLDFGKLFGTNWTAEASKLPVFVLPEVVDLRQTGSKYFQPINKQPVYFEGETVRLVATVNSAIGGTWHLIEVAKTFVPASAERYVDVAVDAPSNFTYSSPLHLSIKVSQELLSKMEVELHISVIYSDNGSRAPIAARFKVLFTMVERPNRAKLMLFDNYHNMVHPFDGESVK